MSTGASTPVQVVVTAADGSTYTAVYGEEDLDPSPYRFRFVATITGGTGRLAGASGSYEAVGETQKTTLEAILSFIQENPVPVEYETVVNGTISLP